MGDGGHFTEAQAGAVPQLAWGLCGPRVVLDSGDPGVPAVDLGVPPEPPSDFPLL